MKGGDGLTATGRGRRSASRGRDGIRTNEHVFRELKAKIITGDLAPGSRLTETTIAAMFGVSRTPVREAFQRLSTEGLVDVDPMRGMIVHAPDSREVLDVLQIRASLDALAATLAARAAKDTDLARLRYLVEAMEEAVRLNHREQLIRANRTFHDVIYDAAGNPRLARISAELRDYVRRFSTAPSESPERTASVLAEHRALLEAIEQRDADAARAASDRHIAASRDYVARMAVRQFSDLGPG